MGSGRRGSVDIQRSAFIPARMMTRSPRFAHALMRGAALALPVALMAPAIDPPAFAQTKPAPTVPTQVTPTPAEDLSAVNRAIRSITTLKANFTQTDAKGGVLNGTLQLKQPGRVRFDYGKEVNLLIIADGKSLTMIDYDVAQVQRWPIGSSPLGALLDPSKDLTQYGKLVETGDPRIVSVEVRDTKHPEYGTISIVFMRKDDAPAGLQLYGWIAKDAQGNRTTVKLSNTVYGAPIADSAFRWRDPRPKRLGPPR
jgi:outer membrane lipoprotein-sorting protein